MDAASCLILTSSTVPASQAEPTKLEAKRLLKQAKVHKKQLPMKLSLPSEQFATLFTAEAELQGIAVLRVPGKQIEPFIGEAQKGFQEKFCGRKIR